MRRALPLALAAALGACSVEHVENPRHSWLPMTAAAYRTADAAKDKDAVVCGSASLGMVPALVLDAATLPFHALGHLFARKPPPEPEAVQP